MYRGGAIQIDGKFDGKESDQEPRKFFTVSPDQMMTVKILLKSLFKSIT